MFLGILIYGIVVLAKKQSKVPLVVIMLLYAQFCLMALVMASQGVISSENREFEDSVYGWYGQMGVLIAYQSFWFLLFSVVFSIVFGVVALLERRRLKKEGVEEQGSSSNTVEMAPATGYTTMGEESEPVI